MEAVVADPEFVDVEGDSSLVAAVLEYETPLPSLNDDDVPGEDGEALYKECISSLLTTQKNKNFRGMESKTHHIYLPKLRKTAHKYSPP